VRLRRLKNGVTLVEVLVAASILGLCAGSAVESLAYSTKKIARVEREIIIQTTLENAIEQIGVNIRNGSTGFGTSSSSITLPGKISCNITTTLTDEGSGKYTRCEISSTWNEPNTTGFSPQTKTIETIFRVPND
jgi:prepilin-type N-terminal cleavage/methylation domain-containing protein